MDQLFLFMKPHRYYTFFIILILLLFGCSSESTSSVKKTPEVAQVLTTTPTPSPKMIITDQSSPVSSITDGSLTAPSILSTGTPSAIPTINSMATTTPIPTLTGIESDELFKGFMATNRGCELPCWWSFKLGDNLESINQTFINLGMPWLVVEASSKVNSDRMGVFDASYYDWYENYVVARLSVDMEFHELNGSIEYIFIFVNRVRVEESQQDFVRDWSQYFLDSFLQRHGKPTQVYFRLRTVADVMDPPQFSLSLLYLDKGLAITYHIKGSQDELCLNIENVQAIELSLFNPTGFDIWGYQFAPYHNELYEPLTWEAEFGMALDTFYETYQHPENLICLTVNSN